MTHRFSMLRTIVGRIAGHPAIRISENVQGWLAAVILAAVFGLVISLSAPT